jgi:hypothetical protein
MIPVELKKIIDMTTVENKQIVRLAYIQSLAYISSRLPGFTVNEKAVAGLDNEAYGAQNFVGWPDRLFYESNTPRYVENIALYKNTGVSLYLGVASIFIKFPTVVIPQYKISSYHLDNWRRSNKGEAYYYHGLPEPWEEEAYKANRVPTKEEFHEHNHNCVYSCDIAQRNALEIVASLNLAEGIEKSYINYCKAVTKAKTSGEDSQEKCYKQYIELKAKVCLELYKQRAIEMKEAMKKMAIPHSMIAIGS